MIMIYGIGLDSEGRCLHYHTKCDVVALKCNKCKEYFACYQCHNQLQNHPFEPVSKEDVAPVICGSCRHFLTFDEYKRELVRIVAMPLIRSARCTRPFILRSSL